MMTQAIAAGRRFCDPVLKIPGWWRRDERILYGREHVSVDDVVVEPMAAETIAGARPLPNEYSALTDAQSGLDGVALIR
jgi:hypothetical protein